MRVRVVVATIVVAMAVVKANKYQKGAHIGLYDSD